MRWSASASSASPRWRSSRRRCSAGMYWKGGTRNGALAGLLAAASLLWAYTLMLPSIAKSGWLAVGFVNDGPWGIGLAQARTAARPERARQPDPCAVLEPAGQRRRPTSRVSLWRRAVGARGQPGAAVRRRLPRPGRQRRRRPGVLARARAGSRPAAADRAGFLGAARSRAAVRRLSRASAASRQVEQIPADAQLVQFVETQLAGAIGSASARVMVAVGRRGRSARPGRRDAHPRRGVAAARLLARARGQVAFAGARHRRAARRQRAAQEPGPAEGRLHVLGDARAAHAADLDPRARRS